MTRLAPITLLLCAAGCVSAPARQSVDLDVRTPEQWTADRTADPGEPDLEWWRGFEDPQLDRMVQLALERNHDLAAAAARLQRATELAVIAGADLKPAVAIGASGSRRRTNFAGITIPNVPPSTSITSSSYGISVDASWEADLWGRIRAGARGAVAEAQATRADLVAARLSVTAWTARSWFAVLEARQQVALSEASVEAFRESAEQVRSRFESGLRGALDLRLALAALADARALLEQRRLQLDGLSRQLEILLGLYPDRSWIDEMTRPGLPAAPPPIPVGLPADLIARRPDVQAAERRLAAADQRLVAARRALYPSLSLTTSGGTSTNALSDLLDGDFRVWSLVANLAQPLFLGGRLRANVRGAGATVDEAIAAYATTVLGAYAEVESALAAEAYLAERERALADSARQLAAARALAEDRYRSGLGIYLAVLESQTRALNAEIQLLQVRRERLNNRVALHLALGGGFSENKS